MKIKAPLTGKMIECETQNEVDRVLDWAEWVKAEKERREKRKEELRKAMGRRRVYYY